MTVRKSVVKTTPPKAKKSKRRSPITREEGERRLADAALQLIKTRPFSEVSVREIAELADVNHGFVHTWFGSKNDLLARVVQNLLRDISEEAEKTPAGQGAIGLFDDRVQLAVRMIIWLTLEGYEMTKGFDLLVLETLRKRYLETEGLNPADAETAAVIAAAMGIGVGSFRPILESGLDVNTERVFPMWRHILGLLAEHPLKSP